MRASAGCPWPKTAVMKGRAATPARGQPADKRPCNPGRRRAPGLAQRDRSGRTGLGQDRPTGKRRGQRLVMDLRPQLCRSDGELGRKKGCGSAAQAVTAARRSVIVPMLVMRRGCSDVVDVLFRTGIQVSGNQMQRSVSIAVGERQRQQQDQASDKQRSHKTRRPRSSRNSSLLDNIDLGHRRVMTTGMTLCRT